MKRVIRFHISKEESLYTAESLDVSVVTQGKTLDELTQNIEEALALHFEDSSEYSTEFEEKPAVLVDYELPTFSCA